MQPEKQDHLPASTASDKDVKLPHQAGENWLDVEIRIMHRHEEVYPVELTLNNEQVFHGELAGDLAAWSSTGNVSADGQALFKALFSSADLAKGWGGAQEKSLQLIIPLSRSLLFAKSIEFQQASEKSLTLSRVRIGSSNGFQNVTSCGKAFLHSQRSATQMLSLLDCAKVSFVVSSRTVYK